MPVFSTDNPAAALAAPIRRVIFTADDVFTPIFTKLVKPNTAVKVLFEATGKEVGGVGRGAFSREALVFRLAAGGAFIEGLVITNMTRKNPNGLDANIVAVGNNFECLVEGVAAIDYKWKGRLTVLEVES